MELHAALEFFELKRKLEERGKEVLTKFHEYHGRGIRNFTNLGSWDFFEFDETRPVARYREYTDDTLCVLPIDVFIDDEKLKDYLDTREKEYLEKQARWNASIEAEEKAQYEKLKAKFEKK